LQPDSNRLESVNVHGNDFSYAYDLCGNLISETTSRHFEWDHANQMTTFRTQAVGAEPSIYAQYRYDAGGTRVVKIVRNSSVVVDGYGAFFNREEFTPYGETSFGSYARKRYRYTAKERDEESGLAYHGARYYAPWVCRWVSCDPSGLVDGPNLYALVGDNPVGRSDPSGRQAAGSNAAMNQAGLAPVVISGVVTTSSIGTAAAGEASVAIGTDVAVGSEVFTMETLAATLPAATETAVGSTSLLETIITVVDVAGGAMLAGIAVFLYPGTANAPESSLVLPGAQPTLPQALPGAPGPACYEPPPVSSGGTQQLPGAQSDSPPAAAPGLDRGVEEMQAGRGDSALRKQFRQSQIKKIIGGDPKGTKTVEHALRFLLNAKGKGYRGPGEDWRMWDAGHETAHVHGGEALMIEWRYFNRSSGAHDEPKVAIDIAGLPVELWTAFLWASLGVIDPEWLRDAPEVGGWRPGPPSTMSSPRSARLLSK
jgi:RHS repeat-associated protein